MLQTMSCLQSELQRVEQKGSKRADQQKLHDEALAELMPALGSKMHSCAEVQLPARTMRQSLRHQQSSVKKLP